MNISEVTVSRNTEQQVTAEQIPPPRQRESLRRQTESDSARPVQDSREDKYIPAPEVNVSNALYDVHNVSGGAPVIISSAPTRSISSSGETVGRKIVEFLLPTGRKSLTIYSMNVHNLNE